MTFKEFAEEMASFPRDNRSALWIFPWIFFRLLFFFLLAFIFWLALANTRPVNPKHIHIDGTEGSTW